MARLLSALRLALFATMVASMVGVYVGVLGPRIPRHPLESTTRLLIPLMVISGLVALPIGAALRRQADRSAQARTIYVGFVLTCLGYGSFLWAFAPEGTPAFLLLALFAGHLLGLPLLIALLGVHFVLARLGFYGTGEQSQHERASTSTSG
jgi:hypothetical protein